MIQLPKSGEVLVDVPGRGPLVDLHARLQPIFGHRLGAGTVVVAEGGRGVDWSVETAGIGELTDLEAARDELSEGISAAIEIADRIDDLLRKSRDPDARVRVPGELMQRMGAPRGEDASLGGRELRYLRDALRRTAIGVRRAVGRQEFGLASRRVVLYGWCFLPGEANLDEPNASAEVTLRAVREIGDATDDWVFHWEVRGWPTSVELVSLDGDGETVAGTRSETRGHAPSGAWRLEAGRVRPGSSYLARAVGDAGEVVSETVRIPDDDDARPDIDLDRGFDDDLRLESLDDDGGDDGSIWSPGAPSVSPPDSTPSTRPSSVAIRRVEPASTWPAWLRALLLWLLWIVAAAIVIWLLYLLFSWLFPPAVGPALDAGTEPTPIESETVTEDPGVDEESRPSERSVVDEGSPPPPESEDEVSTGGDRTPPDVDVEIESPSGTQTEETVSEERPRRPLPFIEWRREESKPEEES